MYMNCAPITVTGGADNNDVYDQLPDMQLANIPSTTCKTVDGSVPLLPNPGDSLDHRGNGPFEKMLGDCGTPSKTTPKMGGGDTNTKSVPSVAAPAPAPTHVCDPCAPLPSFTTSVIASSSATPTAVPTAVPTSPPTPVDTPATNGNGTVGSSCGDDGTMICNGPKQFGICNFGKVVWQDVAAGTQCKDGKITFATKNRVVRRNIAGRVNFNYNATTE